MPRFALPTIFRGTTALSIIGMATLVSHASHAEPDAALSTLERTRIFGLPSAVLIPRGGDESGPPLQYDGGVITLTAATHDYVYSNDRTKNKARAEVQVMAPIRPTDQVNASLDLRLPTLEAKTWTIVQQWHAGGPTAKAPGEPPISLQIPAKNPGELHVILNQQTEPGSPEVRFIDLGKLPVTPGSWHHIDEAITWGKGQQGSLKIWVDGALCIDYVGSLGYDRDNGITFKFGVYRAESAAEKKGILDAFTAEYRDVRLAVRKHSSQD